MARKKSKIDPEAKALDKMKMDIETADRLFGDGQIYDLFRIENEIKFYLTQSAQSLFESGKRFNLIKAHEDYGNFIASLERIGVSERTAQYAMAVTNKFGTNTQAPAYLGAEKIRMLTVLDDEDVKKYANGGSLGDIPHDDVEKMTTRELRDALRKERGKHKKDKTAQEDAIAKKEEKINELEQQLRYQDPPTKEQRAEATLKQYRDPIIDNLLTATERITQATAAIDEAQKIPHVPFEALEKLIEPWKGSFERFLEVAEDFSDAFNNIHVDKGRG